MPARLSQAQRLYSLGLLEEAFKLSKKVGIAEASRVSGVNYNSLIHYRLIRLREEGRVSRKIKRSNSIDPVKKRRCYEVYLDLVARRYSRSRRKCWIEAGKMTGVNGRSVEFQFIRGIYTP